MGRQANKTPEVTITEAKTPKQMFLSLLEQKNLGRNMISVLRDDAQITINDKVLLIKIDHKITMDMLKNKKNYPIVIEAVKQAYGSEVQARLVYEGENQPRKNQEKHKAIVENDPIVSLCMELFSARVIKIDAIHKKQQ